MTKEELVNKLSFLFDNGQVKQTVIYTIASDGNPAMLNINNVLIEQLEDDFIKSIKNNLVDKVYDLQDYSTADRRNNSYYRYDLVERPDDFDIFDKVLGPDIQHFNFNDNWIGGISTLIVVISTGDQRAILYKDISGVEKYYAQGGTFITRSNDRFDKIENDFLRITPKFQMIKVDDDIIFLSMESLERSFDLDQIIKNEANSSKTIIEGLLTDLDKVSELCDKDTAFQKKLIATKSSLVFAKNDDGSRKVSDSDIIDYIKTNKEICGEFEYSDDGTKLKISYYTDAKRLVKILNEDYLKSGLTKVVYDTLAKKKKKEEKKVEPAEA